MLNTRNDAYPELLIVWAHDTALQDNSPSLYLGEPSAYSWWWRGCEGVWCWGVRQYVQCIVRSRHPWVSFLHLELREECAGCAEGLEYRGVSSCETVRTVLYCTVLLYCTTVLLVRYCTILWCVVMHCTVMYCAMMYCIVMYSSVLPYATLYRPLSFFFSSSFYFLFSSLLLPPPLIPFKHSLRSYLIVNTNLND